MTEYRALVGLNYRSTKTGRETRVEVGDKIVDMGPGAVRHELHAGNIEKIEKDKKEVDN